MESTGQVNCAHRFRQQLKKIPPLAPQLNIEQYTEITWNLKTEINLMGINVPLMNVLNKLPAVVICFACVYT